MIRPSLESLMTHVDSRYSLVIIASRRARQLVNGEPKLVDCKSDKPVTVALEEIKAGKIKGKSPAKDEK